MDILQVKHFDSAGDRYLPIAIYKIYIDSDGFELKNPSSEIRELLLSEMPTYKEVKVVIGWEMFFPKLMYFEVRYKGMEYFS